MMLPFCSIALYEYIRMYIHCIFFIVPTPLMVTADLNFDTFVITVSWQVQYMK